RKNSFNLLGRIGEDEVFNPLFYVFLKIVDKQVKIFIERWLRMCIEGYNLLCFVEKLLSEFNIREVEQHVPKYAVGSKRNPRVDPVAIRLYILFRQGFPKFGSLSIAILEGIERILYVF